MKVTLIVAQLALSLFVLLFFSPLLGISGSALAVATVSCLLALPFIAVFEVLGLFRVVFKWLGWA